MNRAVLSRWWLLGSMLLAGGQSLFAATAEDHAFSAAAESFRGTFYERAEREFADFVQKYPASPHVPEALLFQAEARLELTNYAGAIELLSTRQNTVGARTDEYLFWLGEAYLRQGDYPQAANTFSNLVKTFQSSPRALEAGVQEALAFSRLGDWGRVSQLLQETNGVFQAAARTNAGDEHVVRGYLLLSEAQLASQRYQAAEDTLLPLGKRVLNPTNTWQWQYLLCRVYLAEDRAAVALENTSNLLATAANTAQPALVAESFAFKAGVLERLGRADDAIATYTNNLAAGVPPTRQRQALLRITQLSLGDNKLEEAARTLERFLAEYPAAGAADLAWLTLGELRLKQFAENPAAAASPGTNSLTRAMACFDTLTKKFPASSLVGKAQLDLGWCYWSSNNAAASQVAFQAAVEHLPFSPDLATAHFKLADAEFLQTNYAGAITNYSAIIQKFAALPEIETNLFEPALYQIVQAGLAGKDLAAATNALAKILAAYPNGFHTAGAVMMTGQELGRQGNPAEARRMFLDFVKTAPESALRLEVELAIARTYEQETNWTGAIQEYDAWLGRYTNQPARARAEYYRASALYQTGDETNALRGFTNVVAEFPTNELATQAQWWVADYYFRAGAYTRAENDFQLLSRSWPKSELAYQARMMAGRAAVGRLGWSDASNYFAALAGDTNCPEDLRIQALFAYGNTLMSQDSPNKRQDYQEAFRCFDKICTEFPTNPLTVLAWGELAGCLLQWAQSSAQLEDAAKAFQHVIDAPGANVKARSIARVGLGVVLEKQAKEKAGDDQTALRRQALEHYLDVFFYDKILRGDEQPDHFWVRKAGLEAARLASELGDWCQAAGVYQRLARLLPQGRAALEEKYLKAQENCARAKK